MPMEAFLLIDPTPEDIEDLMIKRVSNYKIPKNSPLIIETFMWTKQIFKVSTKFVFKSPLF